MGDDGECSSVESESSISDSDFDDWLELIFPEPEVPHAVLNVYADESESSREEIPVIAVGGGLGSGKEWTALLKAWRVAMATEPTVEVFHASEFESPEGRIGTVYKDWDDPRLMDFQNAMLKAKKENLLSVAPAAAVSVEEFDSEISPEIQKRYGDAYYFCAFMLIHQVSVYAGKFFPNQRVTYNFEEGGPHQDRMRRAYEMIKNDEEVKRYYSFWTRPNFLAKDSDPRLQIADKLVYEAAKHVSHELENERAGSEVWRARYPSKELVSSGWDVHTRLYEAHDIKEVYQRWGALPK